MAIPACPGLVAEHLIVDPDLRVAVKVALLPSVSGPSSGFSVQGSGFRVLTVEYDHFIKSLLASRNYWRGLTWCKFGHVTLEISSQRNPPTPPCQVTSEITATRHQPGYYLHNYGKKHHHLFPSEKHPDGKRSCGGGSQPVNLGFFLWLPFGCLLVSCRRDLTQLPNEPSGLSFGMNLSGFSSVSE